MGNFDTPQTLVTMPHTVNASTASLQQLLQYTFSDVSLLQRALTHRSFCAEHNERLEFLGDGLLNLVAAELLFEHFPAADEGVLSRMRSHLVRQDCLVRIGQQLNVGDLMRLGDGEKRSGGNARPSLMADAVEALFGAIYLDAGFQQARAVVRHLLLPVLQQTNADSLGKDPKTRLQEWLQARHHALPVYHVRQDGGTSKNPDFIVECVIHEPACKTLGQGSSRRIAEQQAAREALARLDISDTGAAS